MRLNLQISRCTRNDKISTSKQSIRIVDEPSRDEKRAGSEFLLKLNLIIYIYHLKQEDKIYSRNFKREIKSWAKFSAFVLG